MAAYPRKQTVVTFLICTVAVLGVAYYTNGTNLFAWTSKKDLVKAPVQLDPVISLTSAISDDWKKQFLVASSSNTSFKISKATKTVEKDEVVTPTSKLGKEFLTKYAELQSSGLIDDAAAVTSVVGKVAAKGINDLPRPKIYTSAGVTSIADDATSMRAYELSLLTLLRDYMPRVNEAIIAESAFSNDSMEELKQIDPIIRSYNALIKGLLATPTPKQILENHVLLINGLSIALYNAESFRHMDTDPVRGLAAVSLELVGIETITSALTNIHDTFVSAGMTFGS